LVAYATIFILANIRRKYSRKWRSDIMDRIAKLKEFLQANPADSFVQHALALEYVKLNDEEKARELFEAILERDPDYVGSYYHLAKLFERIDEREKAIEWYEKGMKKAKEKGDQHAYNELQSAYEDLVY
jgi:tetratricopeptide (TPR) repeat protein